jgi:tRNA threonylcarbamoyladenosine biosynthesis protein TsaE
MFEKQNIRLHHLEQVAEQLLSHFVGKRIFAFYGGMGAGKTTFIQAICHVLGSKDNITSPSFAIINEYTTSFNDKANNQTTPSMMNTDPGHGELQAAIKNQNNYSDELIYHFDFYRIKNPEEAFDLGYEDYFYSGSYCLIEWPEKVENLLPSQHVEVTIETTGEELRTIRAKLAG